MQNDVQKVEAKQMAASDLRERLTAFYGLRPPLALQERFLLAAAEPLLSNDPCENL